MKEYKYITIKDMPSIIEEAALWFHNKWNVSKQAYLDCMQAYIKGETDYGWYLCLDDSKIVAGLGVIKNDFHNRKDLTPNVCAVYTEETYRNQGIAGKLLKMVVDDCRQRGITPLYLVTDHIGFYEKYGWKYLCMVQNENEPGQSRMYVHP